MEKEIVTVIIPVFNSELTIYQSLDSIVKQTRFDLIKKIIVVNDGSTDSTQAVIEKFMQNNRLNKIKLINVHNGGVSRARNIGLKHAETKYIAFLDSDDVWYPSKIERQIEIMENNKNIQFLGTDYANSSHRKGQHYLPLKKYRKLFNLSLLELCLKSYPVTPSIIFTKELQKKMGYFREDMQYCEDINYFQRACAFYKNYFILPETLVYVGIQKNNDFSVGLSSQMVEMQKGSMENLNELRKQGYLNLICYLAMYAFNILKYVIRLVKTKAKV